ncbi:LysR family transcriptional regulator [Clostridium estertheticum]|uniref:LysR family transcriptional regulator n=1 Tax=Clostridium estertheticum TaxID=238834 RepID=UPI001C0E55ED|nr:LysR family transcriptional regulator [Clostridium estertheticum]MBU3071983.1 LysR family transcriptional regulator [Clostridium estertheticum]MBU3162075.1 LysR family transcriptional regulator [Clostridium estertheticum]
MDIRLQTFITVTKIKSFTKASEILNITQPAVSQHIKFLEEYYGVIFIKKCGKSIKLTVEGKILYKYAIELNSIYRNLEAEFRNKDNINKTYYIGASMTIGGYILPYILADYRNCYKNIDILLQVNNTEEIIKKLLNRTIDLALIEGNFDREKFKYIKYKDDELVLAVSHLHEFAKYKNITLDKVLKGKLILREKGSGTREIFENDLLQMGYDLKYFKPYMELGSITAIKSLVEANLGYSIISKETVKKEVESGIIKIIPIKGLRIFREFNFVYIKDSDEEFVNTFIGFCLK